MLVGPDGTHNLLFWSDVGGGEDVASATFIIADTGATPLPDSAALVDGTTYQPADSVGLETDSDFGSATGGINHATTGGSATFASAFDGIDPNGTWTLYARDDDADDTGSLASWTLSFNTAIDLVIGGTAGNDTVVVTATGADSATVSVNGGGATPFGGFKSLTFDGLGGDDTLIIDNFSNGRLAVPIFYDGGGQPGDALENLDGNATSGSYTATGVSSGVLAHQASELQKVDIFSGTGTFTLTFNGQTTATLAHYAAPAQVQAALNALSSIAGVGGAVTVAGTAGSYEITFGGSFANTDVPNLVVTGSGGLATSIIFRLHGGTQTTNFTGLAPVTDTMTESTFTILGTTSADTITITDGGLVGGDQTWLISSPTFESVRVSNKTTLIIDGNGGGDTVSMDTSVTAAGLLNLQIRGVASVTETGAFNLANLTIDATGPVTLTNLNDVDTFSAHVGGPNANVEYRDINNFAVNGITTIGERVILASDAGDITVGTAAANSGIDTGAGNIVRLQATLGSVSQTANGTIASDFLAIRAAGSVALTAAANNNDFIAFSAGQQVEYRDVGNVTISSVTAFGIFTTLTAGVTTIDDDINLQIGGNLLLSDREPRRGLDRCRHRRYPHRRRRNGGSEHRRRQHLRRRAWHHRGRRRARSRPATTRSARWRSRRRASSNFATASAI